MKMFDIVDKSPQHKIDDIIKNNQIKLNNIFAKLLCLTLDLSSLSKQNEIDSSNYNMNNNDNEDDIDEDYIEEQALLSLREISVLGMTNDISLFDKYPLSDDLKYHIICYFDNESIHNTVSKISRKC